MAAHTRHRLRRGTNKYWLRELGHDIHATPHMLTARSAYLGCLKRLSQVVPGSMVSRAAFQVHEINKMLMHCLVNRASGVGTTHETTQFFNLLLSQQWGMRPITKSKLLMGHIIVQPDPGSICGHKINKGFVTDKTHKIISQSDKLIDDASTIGVGCWACAACC